MSARILGISAILLAFCLPLKAQDTLRICTYNLLNYGNSANTHASKKLWLQPIFQEINPSVVGVQEVSTALPGACDSLLPLMPFPAKRGSAHNTTGTTQLNTLIWDSTKFVRVRDTSICNSIRDISAYELYYRPALPADTIKLTVIVAHLKASNTSADAASRAIETQCVSNYLTSLNDTANYIMLGDFNLYESSEIAYQNLINPVNPLARLNDPINTPGNWNSDPSFAAIHTQSPRLTTIGDGGAYGGLDSRFDFILVSDAVLSGSRGIRYVPATYHAVGNDGQHFNKSITDAPANTSVSAAMAQHLYYMSDHLPVVAWFIFTPSHPTGINPFAWPNDVKVSNPFENTIVLHRASFQNEALRYTLLTLDGRSIQSGIVAPNESEIVLSSRIQAGIYMLHISGSFGSLVHKLAH